MKHRWLPPKSVLKGVPAITHKTLKLTLLNVPMLTNSVLFFQKAPFATENPNGDLGAFYKECQRAPPLQEFEDPPNVKETASDLAKQLEDFELSAPKYDELLSSLGSGD